MLTDPPRLARLLADQFVKIQIVFNIIDNKIKLKLKLKAWDSLNFGSFLSRPGIPWILEVFFQGLEFLEFWKFSFTAWDSLKSCCFSYKPGKFLELCDFAVYIHTVCFFSKSILFHM